MQGDKPIEIVGFRMCHSSHVIVSLQTGLARGCVRHGCKKITRNEGRARKELGDRVSKLFLGCEPHELSFHTRVSEGPVAALVPNDTADSTRVTHIRGLPHKFKIPDG